MGRIWAVDGWTDHDKFNTLTQLDRRGGEIASAEVEGFVFNIPHVSALSFPDIRSIPFVSGFIKQYSLCEKVHI